MTRHRVADGENGLHTWKVAASMLNKQSRTAEKGMVLRFRDWAGGINPSL